MLEGHKVIPAPNQSDWEEWFMTTDRTVAKTQLSNDTEVSTVFLGSNHSLGDRVPLLFETLVFGGQFDGLKEHYPTWQDAEEGHQKWVKEIEKQCHEKKS